MGFVVTVVVVPAAALSAIRLVVAWILSRSHLLLTFSFINTRASDPVHLFLFFFNTSSPFPSSFCSFHTNFLYHWNNCILPYMIQIKNLIFFLIPLGCFQVLLPYITGVKKLSEKRKIKYPRYFVAMYSYFTSRALRVNQQSCHMSLHHRLIS